MARYGLIWLEIAYADYESPKWRNRQRSPTVSPTPRREPWGLDEMWIVDPDGLRIGIIEVPPQHPLRRDPRG